MNFRSLICLFPALIGLNASVIAQQKHNLKSPDGKQELIFSLSSDGRPQYELKSGKSDVILLSKLGFEFSDNDPMTSGFRVVSADASASDTTWEQPWGEWKTVRDNHKKLLVHLEEKSGKKRKMDLEFKLFNDGLGFRYLFPKQPNLNKVKISNEITEFNFPADENVWWIPVHRENSYYESAHRKTAMSQTDTINTPAVFETKSKKFLAIHEANLTDFASMTLRLSGKNQYKSELVPWRDGVKVYAEAPFQTPWRTISIGEKATDIASSTLTLNLNEPNKITDFSWIKPTKYIGIWWGMHLDKYTWGQGPIHGATTEITKQYMDFAAANGFDGVLVEGWNEGWDGDWTADGNVFSYTKAYPDFDIKGITDYAASKNVKLIGHHETAGATQNYERQMEAAFALYQKLGVTSVKTGYVNKFLDKKEWHDSQYGVRHYRKVIETAAKYHIMIDNHEPVKGTGLQRTYPNLMAQEGGRGQEYNAWSVDGGNTPDYMASIPFTRMLAGPFDYTPGNFGFKYKTHAGAMVQGTIAQQLALYLVIYSPLQMASDLPENYEGNPAFQFIKDVPADWSDSRYLNGEIGKFVTIARKDRNSKDWYLGSITNSDAREIEVPLDFLEAGKKYTAEIYADGKNAHFKNDPYPVDITKIAVDNKSRITLKMVPGGGTAIRFKLAE